MEDRPCHVEDPRIATNLIWRARPINRGEAIEISNHTTSCFCARRICPPFPAPLGASRTVRVRRWFWGVCSSRRRRRRGPARKRPGDDGDDVPVLFQIAFSSLGAGAAARCRCCSSMGRAAWVYVCIQAWVLVPLQVPLLGPLEVLVACRCCVPLRACAGAAAGCCSRVLVRHVFGPVRFEAQVLAGGPQSFFAIGLMLV